MRFPAIQAVQRRPTDLWTKNKDFLIFTSMSQPLDDVLRGLRAAAEPTRLRMLALLARGEFSVTDLTRILGQSQPRVSRHLKLLCESGLLERFREQHWIYYRVPVDGAGAVLVRSLLALVATDDPAVGIDRERAAEVLAERAGGTVATAGDGGRGSEDAARDLTEVIAAEFGGQPFESVLYLGHEPTTLLSSIGPRARRVLGVSDSRVEVQRARAILHGRGLSHCVLQHGDLQSVPHAGASFDAVILDRVLAGHARPPALLQDAARMLKPAGRLFAILDYDALVERDPSGNPLRAVRDWIAASGLACLRLRPVDLGGRHLLLAKVALDEGAEAAA